MTLWVESEYLLANGREETAASFDALEEAFDALTMCSRLLGL
jgi:hypothetical protein